MEGKSYYEQNKQFWKPGGKYYKYKPKVYVGDLIIKRGKFIISFD